jgi:uncharacterized protein (DUF1499 family)
MSDVPSIVERVLRPFVNNEVATDRSGWYPELRPRHYDSEPEEVLESVRRIAEQRDGWCVADVDEQAGRVELEVETTMVGFVDDVTVEVEREEGRTRANARSQSRVGVGDFGQNARTIRELFSRIDDELGVRTSS